MAGPRKASTGKATPGDAGGGRTGTRAGERPARPGATPGGGPKGRPSSGAYEALGGDYWTAWAAAMRTSGEGQGAGHGAAPGAAPPGFAGAMPGAGVNPFAAGGWGAGGPAPVARPRTGGFAGAGSSAGNPDPEAAWQQALGWWSSMLPEGQAQVEALRTRFQGQAGDWFGTMQKVAAQFADQDPSAADVAAAWREALGGAGVDTGAFGNVFRNAAGKGQAGFDGWMAQVAPALAFLQQEQSRWASAPSFGPGREHQARWQGLARAQQAVQAHAEAYAAQLAKATEQAFERFEALLAERAEPGRRLTSARALFDLWIDAAEESYAAIALTPEFREVYGDLANAQMRMRAAVQSEVEMVGGLLGVPSRSEMDAAHRKIVALERAVRALQADAKARRP